MWRFASVMSEKPNSYTPPLNLALIYAIAGKNATTFSLFGGTRQNFLTELQNMTFGIEQLNRTLHQKFTPGRGQNVKRVQTAPEPEDRSPAPAPSERGGPFKNALLNFLPTLSKVNFFPIKPKDRVLSGPPLKPRCEFRCILPGNRL